MGNALPCQLSAQGIGEALILRVSSRLVELEDGRPVPIEGAKWIQIAAAGAFKGHPSGEFTFDKTVFDQLIKNFRAHASYELDPATGFGKADVIPFDFSHASEEPAAAVGVNGAPAQAWAIELESRGSGESLELWSLTRYLEPARSYVQQGKYKSTSVAVFPNARDPKTGKEIGWYMSSIAFTNDPFIQGMTPIAAQREGAEPLKLNLDHLLSQVKRSLGLPKTATAQDVQMEVAKLRSFATPGQVPPAGVDVERLLADLKDLLHLPLLTDADGVFAEIDKLMGAIAAAPPAPNAPVGGSDSETATVVAEGKFMKEQLLKLARKLGIDIPSDLSDEVAFGVFATRVADKAILKCSDGETASRALGAIAKALGVEDEGAVQRLTEMMSATNDIVAAMPGLAAIMEGQVKAEEGDEEDDIEKVAASRGWSDDIKVLARATRSGGVAFPKCEVTKDLAVFATQLKRHSEVLGLKRDAKKKFLEAYPNEAPAPAHLLTPLVTEPTVGLHSPGLRALSATHAGPAMGDPPMGGGVNIDLDSLPGANLTQKLEAHIRAQAKLSGVTLTYDKVHEQACVLGRKLRPQLMASGR